ncbi:ecdysteroid 22-kinase family protein [Paraburkholderia sp. HP33-1]|uniref:ecdysteroid 22-kinase family protein n=1 Tax=Paraburkholderia sp. HP33-1 TaxID=2883243 RepID=UPI001F429F03|nr:ecdysteroid 22-kinase family protein [Paraburkholderia sp. HP33-1]
MSVATNSPDLMYSHGRLQDTDRLPLQVEEVTSSWLTSALARSHEGVVVESLAIDDVMYGTATKVRVRPAYNARGRELGLPESLIVKGGFVPEYRNLNAYIYEYEAKFFSEVHPRLYANVPACFHAETDGQSGQSIVILEDLCSREVEFCRVQRPLTFAQAAANLDAQARWHAQFWQSSALENDGELGWLAAQDPLPDGETGTYHWGQLKPDVFASYTQLPRGAAVPKRFHDRDWMERALLNLRAFDRIGPMTFLHGDVHLGNLYFDRDGTPGFLDWQSYRRGPWAHDVTYFLISALDIADRPRWERALLEYYLERLAFYGVSNPPSFESALDAYRRHIVYGLFFWLVNPVEWQAEVNNCAVAPRFAMAALDHDIHELMGQ